MSAGIIQYIKDLIDKYQSPRLHAFVAVVASMAMILIAIILTIASVAGVKEITSITMSAYGFLSAMGYLTYKKGTESDGKIEGKAVETQEEVA